MGPGPGKFTVEARPGPVRLEAARTAVVVVDMQNDFAAVGGMFERAGIDIFEGRSSRPHAFSRQLARPG